MQSSEELRRVVEAVKASAKYRAVGEELVFNLAAAELGKGRSHKDAVKATKNWFRLRAFASVIGSLRKRGLSWCAMPSPTQDPSSTVDSRTNFRANRHRANRIGFIVAGVRGLPFQLLALSFP